MKQNIFLSERLMKVAAIISVAGIILSLAVLVFSKEAAPLTVFEKIVKLMLVISLYFAFTHYQWDMMRGIMGGILFSLMYAEGFLVLGTLWKDTASANTFLIMGVQGSLYIATESMSFLMTIIITLNHFIMNYGKRNNWRNVIFNQISILFKLLLYVFLAIINIFIKRPVPTLVGSGIEYIADISIIITLICVESQLEDFKILRQELLEEKRLKRKLNE
ncbi:MAG: hypothetical protein MJZ11_12210 [Lachnospiraceae bacterium]|nr:hypothetical protein [Lachnospiraceae bacterium]